MFEYSCPSCNKSLSRAEYAVGRCSVCHTPLAPAPVSNRPVPELDDDPPYQHEAALDEYGDEPPPRLSSRWKKVQTGLNLMAIALAVIFVCFGMVFLIDVVARGVAAGAGRANPGAQEAQLPTFIAGLVILFFAITYLVGVAMCCFVPAESRVRGRITAAVICGLLGFVTYLLGVLASACRKKADFSNSSLS